MTKNKALLKILLTSFGINLATGCVTGKSLKNNPKSSKTNRKAKRKVEDSKSTTRQEGNQAEEFQVNLNTVNFPKMIQRLKSQSPDYSEKDRMIADALAGKVRPNSLYEATLGLCVIHEAILAGKEKPGFEESDLGTSSPNNKPNSKIPSLEQIASKRQINITGILTRNPHLQSYQTAKNVIKALDTAYNSKNFRTELSKVVQKRASLWTSLGKSLGSVKTAPTATTVPSNPEAPIDFNPDDIQNEDQIFEQANVAANKGLYKKSINLLKNINDTSPLYPAAKEKIKDYSNSAVRKLRTLAAQAFQQSTPVNDLKAKSEYLKTAKSHLEVALEEYPDADQLATVRENLSVIHRNLLRVTDAIENK